MKWVYMASCSVSHLDIKPGNARFMLAHQFSTRLKSGEYADKNNKDTPALSTITTSFFLQ
jgi:hypothetical protein